MVTRLQERDSTVIEGKIQMLSHVNTADRVAEQPRQLTTRDILKPRSYSFELRSLSTGGSSPIAKPGGVSVHIPPPTKGLFVSLRSFQLIMEGHLWNRTEFPTDQSLALCGRKALDWSHDNSHTHACIPPQVRGEVGGSVFTATKWEGRSMGISQVV